MTSDVSARLQRYAAAHGASFSDVLKAFEMVRAEAARQSEGLLDGVAIDTLEKLDGRGKLSDLFGAVSKGMTWP